MTRWTRNRYGDGYELKLGGVTGEVLRVSGKYQVRVNGLFTAEAYVTPEMAQRAAENGLRALLLSCLQNIPRRCEDCLHGEEDHQVEDDCSYCVGVTENTPTVRLENGVEMRQCPCKTFRGREE